VSWSARRKQHEDSLLLLSFFLPLTFSHPSLPGSFVGSFAPRGDGAKIGGQAESDVRQDLGVSLDRNADLSVL
jgi:hypothetical protein